MDDTFILLICQTIRSLSVLLFISNGKYLIGNDTKDQGTCNLGNGNGTKAYGKTTDTVKRFVLSFKSTSWIILRPDTAIKP